jgi:hypothetical protein
MRNSTCCFLLAVLLAIPAAAWGATMTATFTGTATGGSVNGTDATGASVSGNVFFDLSSLPGGSVSGDTTAFVSSGGPQWLTALITVNLPSPVTLVFQRDPTGSRPPDAVTAAGYVPVEDQSASFTRLLDSNNERCCDTAVIGNANSGNWYSPSTGDGVYYYTAFSLAFYQGLPAMLGDSGFPGAIDWSAANLGAVGSGWATSEVAIVGGVAAMGVNSLAFDLDSFRTSPQSAIPEPGTALLAGAALVLVGWLSRRR